jgi:hypothetical protein
LITQLLVIGIDLRSRCVVISNSSALMGLATCAAGAHG